MTNGFILHVYSRYFEYQSKKKMCILDILNIKVKKKYVKYKVISERESWGYIHVIVLLVNTPVIDQITKMRPTLFSTISWKFIEIKW